MSNELIYSISIALQLSGSIILLISFLGNTKEKVISTYFPGSNYVHRDEDNMVVLERDKLRSSAKELYLKRLSFTYLSLGYLISCFGKNEYGSVKALLIIVAISFGLIAAGYLIAHLWAAMKYQKDLKMRCEELKEISDVDTNITNKEIYEIYNSVFPK